MAVARTSPTAAHDLPATRLALLHEPLRMHRGGVLEHPVIAYETLGTLNAARQDSKDNRLAARRAGGMTIVQEQDVAGRKVFNQPVVNTLHIAWFAIKEQM